MNYVVLGFLAWSCAAVGNFLWQHFNNEDWNVAFERTFFQAWVMVIFGLFVLVNK